MALPNQYPLTPVQVVLSGLTQSAAYTNPASSADSNNAYLVAFTHVVDHTLVNPGFSDTNGLEYTLYYQCGRNHFDASAKTTSILLDLTMTAPGAGQRFSVNQVNNVYGMGDFAPLDITTYCGGGGDANGDQGQYLFALVNFQQPGTLARTTIASSYTSMGGQSATLSANVTKSSGPNFQQAIQVSSTAHMSTGDYLTINAQVPGGSLGDGNSEANMDVWGPITVVDGTHIKVPCVNVNQSSGAAIQGATRLTLTSPTGFGQHRIIVNLTQSSYTTGTGYVSSGRTVTGSGTNWTLGMVGGSTTNIGAISFAADNVTASPFSGGSPLVSWYLIAAVNSNTSLTLWHRSFQPTAYTGNGTSAGSYTIAPAARVWYYGDPGSPASNSNAVVLPYNSFTWNVGDTVECAISPELYLSGLAMNVAVYTPGTTIQPLINVLNSGIQPLGTVLNAGNANNSYSSPSFGTVVTIQGATLGAQFQNMFGPCLDFYNTATGFEWSRSGSKAGGYYNSTTGCFELFLGGPSAYTAPSGGVSSPQQGLIWVANANIGNSQTEMHIGAGVVYTNEGTSGTPMPYYGFKYVHSGTLNITVQPGSLASVGWSWSGQNLTQTPPFTTGTYRTAAIKQITASNSPYTINPQTDEILLVDASAGAVTVNLPNAAIYWGTYAGQEFVVKKVDSSGNAVTISRNGSDFWEQAQASPAYTLSAQNKYVRFATNSGTFIAGTTSLAGGSGFTNGTYTLGISGGNAAGTYTVTGNAVTSISITNPGNNYGFLGAPTLSFPSGGGSGASATAIVNAWYIVSNN